MARAITEPRRGGISARSRILIWIMVPVAVAVAVTVAVTGQVLSARVESSARNELAHEGENLRNFAAGTDPATGEGFDGVRQLLERFVSSHLAEDDETFFTIVNGAPDRRSPGAFPLRLDQDPAFVAHAAAATAPSSGERRADGGTVRYAIFPVRVDGDRTEGALVVAEYSGNDDREAARVVRTLAIIGLVSVAVAGLAGWLVAGRVLAPIRAVRRTAEQIDESDLTRRIAVDGNDDVAQLAGTFNHMLDRIEHAFAVQTRFLEDTGHELRTPITIVRGHLEVMGDDPTERAQTMDLVVSELDRMARIVDDLMILGRSERPDFVIPEPVDLTELTVDAAAKAQALAPRRWSIDQVAERTVLADGERLTQALVQLAANAVGHTEDGDRISFGSAVVGDRIHLTVADTGAGIDPEVQSQMFNRFARGSRDRSGNGLGLEIVTRIAAAHGGRVLVDSAPGRGATFTLDLPLVEGPAPIEDLS